MDLFRPWFDRLTTNGIDQRLPRCRRPPRTRRSPRCCSLYRDVLKVELQWLDEVVAAKWANACLWC